MSSTQAFKDAVKLTAFDILKSGEELIPVLATFGPTGAAYHALAIPKEAWAPAIALLISERNPYVCAFVSSTRSRTLEPGEKAERRPLDDPKAEDSAVVIFKEQGKEPEMWLCTYELTSKGKVVRLTEWKEQRKAAMSHLGFLRAAFKMMD